MTTSADPFSDLDRYLSKNDVAAALAWLADHFRSAGSLHQLFDVRLMQARHELGMSVAQPDSIDDLPEPLRTTLENHYVAACREVGQLFLRAGQFREAWMYLRPAGDKQPMATHLAQLEVTDENLEQVLEIALHERVDPLLGYRLVLANYGTCNAITMFDSIAHSRPKAERAALAALLIAHVHRELMASLRADIERRESASPPPNATISELVKNRPELFSDLNYHLDSSHLAATVRVARLVEDPSILALAVELTEYGRRLDKTYQYAGETPFRDLYPASALFFRAQLDQDVEEAIDYFRQQAESCVVDETGSGAADVYVTLLARLGRITEALAESNRLLPAGMGNSGFAPSLMELAVGGNAFEEAADLFRQRAELVNYAAARIEAQRHANKA